MEVELDKIISENGLIKVIGFVLKPSDLYGVDLECINRIYTTLKLMEFMLKNLKMGSKGL